MGKVFWILNILCPLLEGNNVCCMSGVCLGTNIWRLAKLLLELGDAFVSQQVLNKLKRNFTRVGTLS